MTSNVPARASSLTRRLPYFVAPGLLVLVACAQMVLVGTHRLTPWKGGGFGMFSTFDRPSTRALRIWLNTPDGQALVVRPQFDVQEQRLLNMPNEALLSDVAAQIAARALRGEWALYTYDQLLAADKLPADLGRPLVRAELERRKATSGDSVPSPYPRLAALPETWRLAGVEGRSVDVNGARVEVWAVRYDAGTSRLHAELLNVATLTTRRAGSP